MAFGISQLENRNWIFKKNVTVQGNFTVSGNFTFGDEASDDFIVAGDIRVNDDRFLHFGNDEDVSIEYDEDGDNVLKIIGADWLFGTNVGITFRDNAIKISSSVDGQLDIDADGKVSINGKIEPITQAGAASVSGLLLGVGTSADPSTTGVADAKFVELRCQSTASSGDNRLLYVRYELNGAGGGECVRAFTKLTASVGTARGAHISLDMGTAAGSVSGLGIGVDAQLLIGNAAETSGTLYALQGEIWMDGSSSDLPSSHAILSLKASNDATGITKVKNAMAIAGAQGSGNMVYDNNSTGATESNGSVRILVDEGAGLVPRFIRYWDAQN